MGQPVAQRSPSIETAGTFVPIVYAVKECTGARLLLCHQATACPESRGVAKVHVVVASDSLQHSQRESVRADRIPAGVGFRGRVSATPKSLGSRIRPEYEPPFGLNKIQSTTFAWNDRSSAYHIWLKAHTRKAYWPTRARGGHKSEEECRCC